MSSKLAVAYLEKGQWANAAGEFERLAAASKDPKVAPRRALAGGRAVREGRTRKPHAAQGLRALPGASIRRRSSRRSRRAGAWPRSPRTTATTTREAALMREIFAADQAGGAARTDRTRYLGATAALAMAEPVRASVSPGRAGRAAAAPAEAEEDEDGRGAEGLRGRRRVRRRRRHRPRRPTASPPSTATSARR